MPMMQCPKTLSERASRSVPARWKIRSRDATHSGVRFGLGLLSGSPSALDLYDVQVMHVRCLFRERSVTPRTP